MNIFNRLIRKAYYRIRTIFNKKKYSKRKKVFCIGRNKTGTTSMKILFEELGLPVGRQRLFELLVKDWAIHDYKKIIHEVKFKGVAFQDVPFSLPNTYKILDQEFPNSKFILTIRDSPEIWYNSLISFHSKVFGNGKIPTKSDLQNCKYVYKGWMWDLNRLLYDTPEDDIYNKSILMKQYADYNASVIEYFKDKPEKLLVVNIKKHDALLKIAQFLGVKKIIDKMPWENKTY